MDSETVSPIIIQSPNPAPKQNTTGEGNLVKNLPKLIFAVLGVVIVFELIQGYKTLKSSNLSFTPNLQNSAGAKIELQSPKNQYSVGEKIPVTISVFTGGKPTDGTDVILFYDPNLIEATGSGLFTKGTIYSDFPIATSNPSKGQILISGITSLSQSGFNGAGIFGILNLTAKASGKTTVQVDFKPNTTTDSNIVESLSAKNILTSVKNLDLVIN